MYAQTGVDSGITQENTPFLGGSNLQKQGGTIWVPVRLFQPWADTFPPGTTGVMWPHQSEFLSSRWSVISVGINLFTSIKIWKSSKSIFQLLRPFFQHSNEWPLLASWWMSKLISHETQRVCLPTRFRRNVEQKGQNLGKSTLARGWFTISNWCARWSVIWQTGIRPQKLVQEVHLPSLWSF